jgi:hypothetical protein
MSVPEINLNNKQPAYLSLDAGHARVRMNDKDEVIVPEGSQGKISTSGLCGCTAVAAVMKLRDNTHRLYMQHYSPAYSPTGIVELERYLRSVGTEGHLQEGRVVIMHPGDPSEPKAIDDTGTYWLLAVAEHTLKSIRLAIQRYPYDTQLTFRVPGAGTLEAAVDSDSRASVLADLEPLPLA